MEVFTSQTVVFASEQWPLLPSPCPFHPPSPPAPTAHTCQSLPDGQAHTGTEWPGVQGCDTRRCTWAPDHPGRPRHLGVTGRQWTLKAPVLKIIPKNRTVRRELGEASCWLRTDMVLENTRPSGSHPTRSFPPRGLHAPLAAVTSEFD